MCFLYYFSLSVDCVVCIVVLFHPLQDLHPTFSSLSTRELVYKGEKKREEEEV